MTTPDPKGAAAGSPDTRTMTVAHVRQPVSGGTEDVEVLFLESARFYRLCRSNPRFADVLPLLREAMRVGRPLRVRLASSGSDVIDDVQPA